MITHTKPFLYINQFATWILIQNAVKEERLGSRATRNPLLLEPTCVGYKATPKSSTLWACHFKMVPVQWNWTFCEILQYLLPVQGQSRLFCGFGASTRWPWKWLFKKKLWIFIFHCYLDGVFPIRKLYLKQSRVILRISSWSTGFKMILPPPKQYFKITLWHCHCTSCFIWYPSSGLLKNPYNQQK